MSNLPHEPDDWSACPAGALTMLGDRLRADHRRDQSAALMRNVVTFGVLLVAGVGAAWWIGGSMLPGGIACTTCHANFAAYQAHLTGGAAMDTEMASSMSDHLAVCPICRSEFNKQFPGLLSDALEDTGRLLARSDVQAACSAWRFL